MSVDATRSGLCRQILREGGSDGPPIVLVHGFASSGRTDWMDTGWPQAVAGTGRWAVVPDLRGHGASPAPASAAEVTAPAMAGDLVELLEDLGAERADVVGYSLGARIAWELPDLAPGRIRRMVLGGLSPHEPFAQLDVDHLRAVVAGAQPTHPMIGMIAAAVTSPGRDPQALLLCIEGLKSTPFNGRRPVHTLPTLFVAGSDDMMTQGMESLVEVVHGSTLTRVPGDHMDALRSAEFRAAALAFLASD